MLKEMEHVTQTGK